MASAFLVWVPGSFGRGICVLSGAKGFEDAFEIDEGVSRAADWPAGAHATMSKKFPKDIKLADSLVGCTHVVISVRVKNVLEEAGASNIEFLPLQIINHKGRIASPDYFILNPLESIDCIDMAASGAKMNPLDPGTMYGVAQLVLREDAVPPKTLVFRTKSWTGVILIRRELAAKLLEAGLTGLRFIEPSEYKGLD